MHFEGRLCFIFRIHCLPVRISVRTAKQCRFFFNFSSIFKGKKQQIDAIFSDFAIFETIFFRKCSSIFWFFVAVAGKISSSCSQSRRKNSKIHWYGLFLAGRSWRNFDATSYCKSEQTRLDHNSAKLARIENSFGGSLGGVFLCYWSNFQLGRWSVGLSFFILHSSFLPVSGSKGKG